MEIIWRDGHHGLERIALYKRMHMSKASACDEVLKKLMETLESQNVDSR
jgi:RNA binding exosome subunit